MKYVSVLFVLCLFVACVYSAPAQDVAGTETETAAGSVNFHKLVETEESGKPQELAREARCSKKKKKQDKPGVVYPYSQAKPYAYEPAPAPVYQGKPYNMQYAQ